MSKQNITSQSLVIFIYRKKQNQPDLGTSILIFDFTICNM